MRDLINKLALLESNTYDKIEISNFIVPWKDKINLPITFLFPIPVLEENRMAVFDMSYDINENTGLLENDSTNTIYLKWVDDKFATDFWDNLDWDNPEHRAKEEEYSSLLENLIAKDISLGEGSKIRDEVKKSVLNMGFSNEAANDIVYNITVVTSDVAIQFSRNSNRSSNAFFNEVNAAYRWLQETSEDL